MCITATVAIAGAMLASAAVTAGTSIMSANANAANAKYQNDVRQKELDERAKLSRLAAQQRENAAASEFADRRSKQYAAMALAQGFNGENISFFQGMDPEQKRQFGQTSMAIRLGLAAEESSIRDQVKISDYSKDISLFNSSTQKIAAVGNFIGDAAKAGNFYNTARG